MPVRRGRGRGDQDAVSVQRVYAAVLFERCLQSGDMQPFGAYFNRLLAQPEPPMEVLCAIADDLRTRERTHTRRLQAAYERAAHDRAAHDRATHAALTAELRHIKAARDELMGWLHSLWLIRAWQAQAEAKAPRVRVPPHEQSMIL
jgi:hypothetical protein